ncbi:hypothetical protein [Aeromicrobium ginsengisoli]|uniref:hypothetical protein n=1 Tax=Aeromicrobium ginsengisoli TaxID=363867 RepID=UPI00165F2B14|nr:hypothetical protein [Aeromicrobium ginsengisoli]
MSVVHVVRLTVIDPNTHVHVVVHALCAEDLPLAEFPGQHLIVEPIEVDLVSPEYSDAISRSFFAIVASLRVRR